MKEKIRRIANLIVLIALAIVAFIFVKNIPSMLIGKEGNIQKIEKIQEQNNAMAPDAVFYVHTGENFSSDGTYIHVTWQGLSQIYCAEKGV